MDIVLISSAPARNEERKRRVTRVPAKPTKPTKFIEKRRNREDRRKSVREGVVVRLSYRNDRRVNPDRRRSITD